MSSGQKRGRDIDSDEEEEFEVDEDVTTKSKTTATPTSGNKKPKTTDVPPTGDAIFSIGSKRKVTVSVFKGKVLVNIREFYEDKMTGEEKPGNKGIALTKEQWDSLKSQLEEIDTAVEQRSK